MASPRQRLMPRETASAAWGAQHSVEGSLRNCSHLPKTPAALAVAGCIAWEPGGFWERAKGGCKAKLGTVNPSPQTKKLGPSVAREHL